MSQKRSSNKSRYAVVVLGMHRSGTSALAGVLARLGCDVPSTIMPANEFNPKGFYESLKAYGMNDAILASGGSAWDDWQPFNPSWVDSPRADEFLARGEEVLNAEYGTSRLFVLKDPRICRLMPFWSRLFDDQGITPIYVNIHRNPLEVAKSLHVREGWPFAYGMLLWLRHVLEAEHGSRGAKRCFTSYDRLLSNWGGVVGSVQSRTGLTFPRLSDTVGSEIEEFLSAGLRNSLEASDNLRGNPMVSKWVRKTFDILERWSEKGEDEADFAKLDAVRSEFDAAAPIFGKLLQDVRENAKDSATLKEVSTELDQARAATDAKHRDLLAQSEQLRGLQTEVQGYREQAERMLANANRDRAEISAANTQLTQLKAELDNQRDAAESARTSGATAVATAADAKQALEDIRAEMQALRQKADHAQQSLAAAEAARAGLVEQLQAAKEDTSAVAAVAAEKQLLAEELERANAQIEQAQEQMQTALQDLRLSHADLSARNTAYDALEVKRIALERANAELSMDLSGTADRLEALEQAHKDLEQEKWQLKSELVQRSHEAEEVGRQNGENAAAAAAAMAEATALRSERDALSAERDQTQKSVRLLRVQMQQTLEQELATALAENRKQADARLERLRGELLAMEKALKAATEAEQHSALERARLTEDRDRNVAEREHLTQEHGVVTQDRDRLALLEAQHRERIAVLESEAAALRTSTSWKITGPLRRIVTVLRGQ